MGAVLDNYSILMETLDEVHQTIHDEYDSKSAGLLSLFGLKLGDLLFGGSETLSMSLQGKDIILQEAFSSVNLAKAFSRRRRSN